MNHTHPRRTSALLLTAIYTAIFLFGIAVFLGINHFFPAFDSSVSGIIVVVVAATTMAQIWTFWEQSPPTGRRAWIVSILCAGVTTLLLGGAALLSGAADAELLDELKGEGGAVLASVLGLAVLAVDLIVIRLSVWLGPRFKPF